MRRSTIVSRKIITSFKMNLSGHLSWITGHAVVVIFNIVFCCNYLSWKLDSIACCCVSWLKQKCNRLKIKTAVQNENENKVKNRKKQKQKNYALMRNCWLPISNLSFVWLDAFSWWCL